MMEDNYDFSKGVRKNYSSQIPDIEKLRMILLAFKASSKLTKDEIKKEVDLVLA